MRGRLRAICSLIKPCAVMADVGCDHGLVSVYALRAGVGRVIAADISEGALEKARRALRPFGSRARFVLSDGFDRVDERVDEAVIAGLGGRLIAEIVDGIGYRPRLVLAPQHDVPELRRFLTARGYAIVSDFCLYERGKFYEVLAAEEGDEPLTEAQYEYGAFCFEKSAALKRRLEERMAKLRSFAPTPENEKKLALAREVIEWQR